ncbi:S1 RNA-binding domain-containing protein [Aliikangiella maris]|uniref:S1-like domain-containing RNA-binding protein n=2 Tax=Aliikangiella maris TaxID=3162458 RepID=A0ABV2BY96_9GAMM
MIKVGQFNFLKIASQSARGGLLEAGELGQIFLPAKQLPAQSKVGDRLSVFLYRNSHDEIVATTQKPKVEIGGIACLKVTSVTKVGAFVDWGLPKELLIPFGEQTQRLKIGDTPIVFVYLDNSDRLCASTKLNKKLVAETQGLKSGDAVNLIVGDKSDLGYKMVVNQKFWGLLHFSDVVQPLQFGQILRGYIKNLRPDRRVDISLVPMGLPANSDSLSQKIMQKLSSEGGYMAIGDKTPPEQIYQLFGVSKKRFKSELGKLFKQRRIIIETSGIRLTGKKPDSVKK